MDCPREFLPPQRLMQPGPGLPVCEGDELALGGEFPEQIRVIEGSDALFNGCESGKRIVLRSLWINPVDPPVLPVAVVVEVGVSGAELVVRAERIVIADGVVPVRDPDRAIGADLGGDGGGPGVGGGVEVVFKAGGLKGVADILVTRGGHQVHGRFANEGPPVPPLLREAAGGVDSVTSAGGTLLLGIVLEVITGDGVEELLAVGAGHLRRLLADHLVVAVRDG